MFVSKILNAVLVYDGFNQLKDRPIQHDAVEIIRVSQL